MKLVITQNITLDGVVEAVSDWFSPEGGDDDTADLLAVIRGHMDSNDGFLVGRRTFEEMRGYWPEQTDDTTGISAHLDQVDKFVVSTTIDDPAWEPTTVLRGDPVEEVRALKQRPGRDLGVTGSITLCHALIGAGIVDEYRLFVFPVVLGRGRRLFPDGTEIRRLELIETTRFRAGVALLTYRPSGPDAAGRRARPRGDDVRNLTIASAGARSPWINPRPWRDRGARDDGLVPCRTTRPRSSLHAR